MDEKPDKERSDVPEPAPVVIDGVRYEAVPWGKARGLGQNGGYIAAFDGATNRELWILRVYEVTYDGEREDDKQDVFIEDLSLEKNGLLRVTDERGRAHMVDIRSRRVVRA
jgi:hypothetical protein